MLAREIMRLLLAAWLGAAILFTTVVAPAAFAVLPTTALAALLVGRLLPVVFYSGALIAAADLMTEQLAERPHRRLRRILVLLTLVGCLIAQLVIGRWIGALREQIGPSIAALSLTDPRRGAFMHLHAASVALLAVAMLSTFASIVIDLGMRRRALAGGTGRD